MVKSSMKLALNEARDAVEVMIRMTSRRKAVDRHKTTPNIQVQVAHALAPLYYSLGIIVQLGESTTFSSILDEFTKLHELHKDDFVVTRYFAKMLVGYFPKKDTCLNLMMEQV